ncbi:MAG: right-handed parallel beta-helix repeat-containing protein [Methanobacteriota archaeon]|nr:MAG: right-handed parallel beta-helix repeat-containing protein [Euryarchaeota archaeon]
MTTRFGLICIIVIFLISTTVVSMPLPPFTDAYTEISTPIGTVVWGRLDSDKTWTADNSPYIIEGYVTVANGVTLSIEAGVTVHVNRSLSGGELYVDGNFVVSGTEDAPVILTSNSTSPAFDDWGNLWVNSSAHAEMNWTEMWFGHGFLIVSDGNIIHNSKFIEDSNGVSVIGSGNLLDGVTVSQEFLAPAIWVTGPINTITNSTLRNNTIGLLLDFGASGSIIVNITFKGNSNYGLGIRESISGIRVHHNNFIANTRQAVAKEANALYNDTYPSGGNFWSDYTGIDECSGPNQDVCPDPDLIGDTRYDIPHVTTGLPVAWDFYPLMCPTWGCISVPAAPTNLTAELTGSDFENVTLAWNLSEDDVDGQGSLVRYDILKGTNYSSNSSEYMLHDSVLDGISSYEDIGAGEGDPNNYFYVVCAVDFTENFTCSDGQAGKFTRPLSEGPNLVSFPLILTNESTEFVLRTVSFDKAWFFDSFDQEWKSVVKSKPYPNDLEYLNHTIGFWVNVKSISNFTVAGVVPSTTTIHLRTGWNLIGLPSFNSSFTVAELKSITSVLRIEGYDPVSSPYHLRVLADSDILAPGYGNWLWVDVETIWIVECS